MPLFFDVCSLKIAPDNTIAMQAR